MRAATVNVTEQPILHLTIIEGAEVHSLRVTNPHVRMGRDATNDLVLRDRFVSSHHAEIRVEAGRIVLRDLRSTNGTRIRRNRWIFPVDHERSHVADLEDGDEVLLGQPSREVILRVSVVQPGATPARGEDSETRIVESVSCQSAPEMAERFGRDALAAMQALAARMRPKDEPTDVISELAAGLLDHFPRATHVTVHLLDAASGEYLPAHARSRGGPETPGPLSRTLRDQVLGAGQGLSFVGSQSESLQEASIHSGLCVPLWSGDRVPGIVQVDRRGLHDGAFTRKELGLLVAIAHQAGLVLELSMVHASMAATIEKAVHGVVTLMESRDEYMAGHSQAVSDLARRLAQRLALQPAEVSTIARAAALHDLGRFGVPAELLNRPGELDEAERRAVRMQPEVGAAFLDRFGVLQELVPIIRHVHESWDGTGYPSGLAGEDIPLGARIVAVADVFHTLVSHRAHRQAMAEKDALETMAREAGKRFDPRLLGALEDVVGSTSAAWGADEATVMGWTIDASGNLSIGEPAEDTQPPAPAGTSRS